jgi:lipopolysaccharide export system permease protein
MIFRNALLRELAISALGVFLVLLAITVTTQLIRFLGDAATGNLATEGVLAMLGFRALYYFPILLSLTLFISVLMTMSRSYRDSEMIAWFSAGLSTAAWIRPVVLFAAPLVFTIALLSLILAPWATTKGEELRSLLENRDDVSTLAPGVFKESKQSERVYFVENFSGEGNSVSNIFAQSLEHGKLGIMVAQGGTEQVMPNGDRFLILTNGRRYEGLAGSPEYRIVDFEKYAIRVQPYESQTKVTSAKALPTPDLWRDPTMNHLAELHWRFSLPLSALILALFAIPMSYVNPRMGRSINLIVAVLIYMIYSNFVSITQAWIAQNKISLVVGFFAVHGMMLVLLAILFYRRLSLFSFRFRRR